MKMMQHGGPTLLIHRCIVAYGFCCFIAASVSSGHADEERGIDDFAQVYVNEYFPPDDDLVLNEGGEKKSRALSAYALGRSLEGRGRVDEAIEAYQTVLENQPDQHFLARKTAYLLARSGRQEEALALLEKNVETNPDEPFAHISLSEYLSTYRGNDLEDRERAFTVIEEALEKFPDEPAVYDHLVKLYLVAQRKDEARTVIENAARRGNLDPKFWIALGKIAGRVWPARVGGDESDLALVNLLFGKALLTAGTDYESAETVGDFYLATTQFPEAASVYKKVIAANPDRLDLREKLARVYGGMGNESLVIETLKEIIEIDPQSARTLKQIAGIYLRREQFSEAMPYLRRSLAITKGSATEYLALVQMMFTEMEFEIAYEFLEESAYLFPDSPEFPLFITAALGGLKRWEESLPYFKETLKLAEKARPDLLDQGFYFRYAAAMERAGNLDEAATLFQKTIELIAKNDPNDENQKFTATVYNYLGYMWLENDIKIDEAGELIKTAADLDPESGAIADSLGWFYFKKGRFEEARVELLRAEEAIEQADPVIFDHLGQVYFALGEKAKAIDYLEQAVAKAKELEMPREQAEIEKRLEEYRAAEDPKPPAEPKPVTEPAGV